MSFSDQRRKINLQLAQVYSVQEYHREYLTENVINWIDQLAGEYIVHLYNDLLGENTKHDLKAFLNESYTTSNEHAKNCISIAITIDHLYGAKVKDWTNSSLPAFDNFLINLIQDKLKEKIVKSKSDKLYESDIYLHLIGKGGVYETIGVAFQSIYQKRNELMHIQVEDKDGLRRQIKWGAKKYKQAKELIIFQFKVALKALDTCLSLA